MKTSFLDHIRIQSGLLLVLILFSSCDLESGSNPSAEPTPSPSTILSDEVLAQSPTVTRSSEANYETLSAESVDWTTNPLEIKWDDPTDDIDSYETVSYELQACTSAKSSADCYPYLQVTWHPESGDIEVKDLLTQEIRDSSTFDLSIARATSSPPGAPHFTLDDSVYDQIAESDEGAFRIVAGYPTLLP